MRKYSFVIPTYNRKELLKNTLEALNRQDGYGWDDYEVIVVDDGSDDGTCDYIKGINRSFELKYVYLERSLNSSRSRARNCGWRAAQGEIIVFIDSDIIVGNNHLLELDRCFNLDSNIVVIGNRLKLPKGAVIDFDNLHHSFGFNRFKTRLLDITYYIYERLSYNMAFIRVPGYLLPSCNAAIPKKYLERVNGFDENFKGWGHEDCELGYRLQLIEGLKFVINSKMDVFHQCHEPNEGSGEGDKNMNYLKKKHPFTPDNRPMEEVFKIWHVFTVAKNTYLKKHSVGWKEDLKSVELDFKDARSLESFKNEIASLVEQDGLDIVINDYVEDTDLDIWVQLLGIKKSTPRYYPVSKTNLINFSMCEVN